MKRLGRNENSEPKLFRNFFERPAGHADFDAYCFSQMKQVLHVFDPFPQSYIFGIGQDDFLRAVHVAGAILEILILENVLAEEFIGAGIGLAAHTNDFIRIAAWDLDA